ncbi:putative adenylate kinase [Helianthus annuus]|nr:putative adenylate kinase [Helianthus annuus]
MAALTLLLKPSSSPSLSLLFKQSLSTTTTTPTAIVSHIESYHHHHTPNFSNPKLSRNFQWVFLGCPGVGKGTYASRLSNLLGVPHIATDLVFLFMKSCLLLVLFPAKEGMMELQGDDGVAGNPFRPICDGFRRWASGLMCGGYDWRRWRRWFEYGDSNVGGSSGGFGVVRRCWIQ